MEGQPVNGVWTESVKVMQINCLVLLAVSLALKHFLPQRRGCCVLVRSDNTTVVAYINRQGKSDWGVCMPWQKECYGAESTCCLSERHMCQAKWISGQTCCQGGILTWGNGRSTQRKFRKYGTNMVRQKWIYLPQKRTHIVPCSSH